MAEITTMKTPAETALANLFTLSKATLPGDGEAREEAFSRFARQGLPHRRVEEWKYTDLRAAMRDAAPLAPVPSPADAAAAAAGAGPLGAIEAARVTLVNGHFVRDASDLSGLPEGVEVIPLAEALASHPLLTRMGAVEAARDNPAYALNAALMTDGAVIRVPAGTTVERPIHLRFVNAGESAFASVTRVLLVAELGAAVTLIESHEGPDGLAYQTNGVLEIVAGDHTKIRHVRLNAEGMEALALSTLTAKVGASADFDSLNVVFGSAVSRHQVFLACAGEHSNLRVNGTAMLKGKQHADSTLLVDHAVPHCTSRELFKTVIDGAATGVFQGKIIVRPIAQKTDGRMMSGALLLSEEGTMNNKPELEIFADDVQCAHGATCGQLEETLLFYLMARGLPRPEAERLMVQAFVGEAIDTVEHEELRGALLGLVDGWLKARA